jgi:hypothetical protein
VIRHAESAPASARIVAATIAAVTITDRTCELATGLSPRPWRRALEELGVPHTRVGRRTVCTVAAWVLAIERASGAVSRPSTGPTLT